MKKWWVGRWNIELHKDESGLVWAGLRGPKSWANKHHSTSFILPYSVLKELKQTPEEELLAKIDYFGVPVHVLRSLKKRIEKLEL